MTEKEKVAEQPNIVNKSRRTAETKRDFADEISKEVLLFKPPPPMHYGWGEYLFVVAQGLTILFFGLFTEYGEGTNPLSEMQDSEGRDIVQNLYPFFQDVHVMIFIGFGFLMTFIKTSSWSALSFNWIISIWALQWGILSNGFWYQVMMGVNHLERIPVRLENLIVGDFGAGAAMITFGAILGKCNLQQLFFLVFWEMIWWGFNEAIGVELLHATDMGGSMFVHTFGAYFGVAA